MNTEFGGILREAVMVWYEVQCQNVPGGDG
jgi:hypothetical protein